MAEILASLDDINAELPSEDGQAVVVADDENTSLIQIAVSRVVRGYLSRIIDTTTLAGWNTPENTPEYVSTAAGKLIAAQLYLNRIAGQTSEISDQSFAQRKYNEAIAMLEKVVTGEVTLPDITVIDDIETISSLDFFPVDSTDRSFTKSQPFN